MMIPPQLMVNPDAKPFAFHKTILVPIHWRDEVKTSLDDDV